LTPSRDLLRITGAILRKDWTEHYRAILIITGGFFVPVLLTLTGAGSPALARGLKIVMISGSAFFFGQMWFHNERRRGTLDLLLSLPVAPRDVVAAKYVSLCSAVLFSVNVPGLVLLDFHGLFVANSFALFLAAGFMAATVVSDKPWAPQIPFWIVMLFLVAPLDQILRRFSPEGLAFYTAVCDNPDLPALIALMATPLLVVISVGIFQRKTCSRS